MQSSLGNIVDKTGNEYLVKVASVRDVKSVIGFYDSFSAKTSMFFHPHGFDANSLKKILDKKNDLRLLLINNNKRVIGYSFLSRVIFLGSVGYFGIGIADKYQGRGLGKSFMKKLFKISKNWGFNTIVLNVYKSNLGAIALYKNLGFKKFEPNLIFRYLIMAGEVLKNDGLLALFGKMIPKMESKNDDDTASVWMQLKI